LRRDREGNDRFSKKKRLEKKRVLEKRQQYRGHTHLDTRDYRLQIPAQGSLLTGDYSQSLKDLACRSANFSLCPATYELSILTLVPVRYSLAEVAIMHYCKRCKLLLSLLRRPFFFLRKKLQKAYNQTLALTAPYYIGRAGYEVKLRQMRQTRPFRIHGG
jgi:hypothetical protein